MRSMLPGPTGRDDALGHSVASVGRVDAADSAGHSHDVGIQREEACRGRRGEALLGAGLRGAVQGG